MSSLSHGALVSVRRRSLPHPPHLRRSRSLRGPDFCCSHEVISIPRTPSPLSFPPMSEMQDFVAPGDTVSVETTAEEMTLGEGLRFDGAIRASRTGRLCRRGKRALWVEGSRRRYVAEVDDAVLGVVEQFGAEFVRVNIFGTRWAKLPVLAFEGATKRNRPPLLRGTLVFCRVLKKGGVLEPELTCLSNDAVRRKDWFTGEALYGELTGGFMLRCSSALARELLKPDCAVLLRLAKHLAFEIAVGANGAFWVNAATARETCVVANAVKNSEFLSEEETSVMVADMIRASRTEEGSWDD